MKTIKNCTNCANAVFCPTWGEWKCITLEQRFLRPTDVPCMKYAKPFAKWKERPVNWKRRKCQCEDCLKNDALAEEYLEEK